MVGGVTPSTRNFGLTGLRWSKIADFEPIFARNASAITPSEKNQLTLIESPLRTALSNEPKMIIVRCPKIALRFKKVCYKVSLCKNCQRQSCTAFIGVTISAKMVGGDVPFHAKIWRILTHPSIFYPFLPVAPQP